MYNVSLPHTIVKRLQIHNTFIQMDYEWKEGKNFHVCITQIITINNIISSLLLLV